MIAAGCNSSLHTRNATVPGRYLLTWCIFKYCMYYVVIHSADIIYENYKSALYM